MNRLFVDILDRILLEQEESTENNSNSVFTPRQQQFLGKFAAYNTTSLGILYSKTATGIEEFILRAGPQLNLTPDVFNSLMQSGVISLQPYGSRRTPDWTIQLELPLADVAQFAEVSAQETPTDADVDGSIAPSGGAGGGGGMTTADLDVPGGDVGGDEFEEPGALPGEGEAGEEPTETEPTESPEEDIEDIPGAPEESFTNNGKLIVENEKYQIYNYTSILEQSTKTLKQILSKSPNNIKIHSNKSRVLNRLPKGYIFHLERIIELLSKRLHNDLEKEHLIADILDNLAHNFGLTPNQILKSYTFYRHQNKLKNIIKK